MFPGFTLLAGPKHSTSVPFSAESAEPLSVDVKEVDLVPNPIPGVALNVFPQIEMMFDDLCTKTQSLFPPTLQIVIPFMSPETVHLKVKVPPGQVGWAAVNCPATSPRVIG